MESDYAFHSCDLHIFGILKQFSTFASTRFSVFVAAVATTVAIMFLAQESFFDVENWKNMRHAQTQCEIKFFENYLFVYS